jgi:GNAT superfamily N-acetyltransferase
MPDPVPVIVLGRLAVDSGYQGAGLGGALLRNAIRRTLRVSTEIAVKAMLVHAISPDAHRFYLSFGFVESEADKMTLFMSVATMAATLE